MALMEKKRYQGRRARKRVYKKRRRTGFYVFVGLVILTLVALIFFGPDPTSEETESVNRVEDPTVAGPPEAVSEEEAAEEEAAEEDEEEAKPPPPEDPTLFMTIPRLGIVGHTVINDDSEAALDLSAIKLPSTGFPWQKDHNTYIAGHRIGWPWNETDYQFFNLPLMRKGDEVILTDTNGTVYTYEVSEIFAVTPYDTWVADPVAGREMVSLQTCTETPYDWWTIGARLFGGGPDAGRLVVRADLADIKQA